MRKPIVARPGCQFASDNAAGVSPQVWQQLFEANVGYAPGYGDDEWTDRLSRLLRDWFETDCEIFVTYNGTAANALALSHMCRPYHSIVCADTAHIETDECGSPEFFSGGVKLLLAVTEDGKLRPEHVDDIVLRRSDIHYPKPKVISVTQSTEVGTVYRPEELQMLCEVKRRYDLRMHMDGARLANSLATLSVSPAAVTWKAGIDVLSLGGTKNGLPIGDIVVFFQRELAAEFDYRCKQAGQLASKMRFLSAPWLGLLTDNLWHKNAAHANQCAQELAARLTAIQPIRLRYPCEANAVFVDMPAAWLEHLRAQGWIFYTFIGRGGARFMCSWQTTSQEIDKLIECVQLASRQAPVVDSLGR